MFVKEDIILFRPRIWYLVSEEMKCGHSVAIGRLVKHHSVFMTVIL